MLQNDIDSIGAAARAKSDLLDSNFGKYFLRAMLAGAFIVVAVLLSNVTAAVLFPTFPQFGKLAGGFLFSIAIVLIVFIGGELFTGNNMTMAVGYFNKNVKASGMVKVWLISYIGNAVGCFIFGGLFILSGTCQELLTNYFNSFIMGKLEVAPLELFVRGILCNFMVCLAVFVNTRMKTESGKLVVMYCVIMTFVISGFEHCVANMGIFTIAGFLMGGLPVDLLIQNFVFVTIGNIVGGAIFLGLPLKLMATDK